MIKTDLGKVSLLPKGNWSPTVNYDRLDIVTFKGSSYVAKNSSLNIPPIEDSQAVWQLLASAAIPEDEPVVTIETLVNLPIYNYILIASLISNTAVSFEITPNEGDEFYILVKNTGLNDIKIAFPNIPEWIVEQVSIDILAGETAELSILRLDNHYRVLIK